MAVDIKEPIQIQLLRNKVDKENGKSLINNILINKINEFLNTWNGVILQGPPGSDALVTKENVEAVLTGEITSHTHAGSGGTGNSYFPTGW